MSKAGSDRTGAAPVRVPKRRHLPSLGSFATFEVAAKHLSFTLAASELHVTQAAISQQIRGLEKALDCRLFVRKHNSMELTDEGRTLLHAVTQGLDRLSDAIVMVGRNGDDRTITISSTYAGVSLFLKPIADAWQRQRPEARFVLLASDENDHLQHFEEVDLSFICGNERSEVGNLLTPLFPEIVEPVCAPSYIARHGPLKGVEDLQRANLMELHRLHWSADAISWFPLRWSDWFREYGPEIDEPVPGFVTNSYGMLVQAALDGQGVILGWRHLVASAIADGRLISPFGRPKSSGRVYFLRQKEQGRKRPHLQAFVEFLRAQVEPLGRL